MKTPEINKRRNLYCFILFHLNLLVRLLLLLLLLLLLINCSDIYLQVSFYLPLYQLFYALTDKKLNKD